MKQLIILRLRLWVNQWVFEEEGVHGGGYVIRGLNWIMNTLKCGNIEGLKDLCDLLICRYYWNIESNLEFPFLKIIEKYSPLPCLTFTREFVIPLHLPSAPIQLYEFEPKALCNSKPQFACRLLYFPVDAKVNFKCTQTMYTKLSESGNQMCDMTCIVYLKERSLALVLLSACNIIILQQE